MTLGRPQGEAPYCGAAPLPSELLGRWNLDPVLIAVLALCLFGLWRVASPGQGGKQPLVAGGAVLALFLFITPFCALTSALFSARVVHHILLTAVLAPLLAFSLPQSRLPKVGPIAAWTFVQAAVFWAWHAPDLYSEALSNDGIYWLMQTSLSTSSVGFWLAVRRSTPTAAVGALLATMVQMGLLGALITFAGQPLYAPHFGTTIPWGLSRLEDQQLAGLIMWAPSASIYLAAALMIAARWLRAEGRMVA